MLVEDIVRTCEQYLFIIRGRVPRSTGEKYISQPGAPGETVIRSLGITDREKED